MATKTKTPEPELIAVRSNHNKVGSDSVYAWVERLYRTHDGRYYTNTMGGAAMRDDERPSFLSRAEAVEWIATEAHDSTGYGYTRAQAEKMVDGIDAGRGWRDDDDASEAETEARRKGWEG